MKSSPLLLIAALVASAYGAPSFKIAEDGVALAPIIVGKDASEQTRVIAATLSDYLNRISGAEFEVLTSGEGIDLRADTTSDPTKREHYEIRTSTSGMLIRGATELGLQHAVWDLLNHLGYRQFFPGQTWEVIPSMNRIEVSMDKAASPDYLARRIWYGYGFWDYNRDPYNDWCRKNRMADGLQLRSGHAYGQIIKSQQEAFDTHPEYYALVDGERQIKPHAKLCIGNPAVPKLAVKYALRYFAKSPDQDCVSVDPSDGGGWCECELCENIGPPSDRALLLANTVAKALDEKAPDKFVGMYAYGYHSPPPSFEVHPKVIIATATAFIKGGSNIDEVMAGWQAKGAQIGIREYYSVHTWDRDLPGAARGSNLKYLAESIPHFFEQAARYMNAESSDNWGCNGLGYYFASRALWDVNEVRNQGQIVEDFLEKAFGAAREPMGEFYELLEGSNKQARLVYEDLIGRMYRKLEEASKQAKGDEAILARIHELVLYTRYVELFDDYRSASGEERQRTFEAMIRHAYRMRKTMLIHVRALYRDVPARDKSISVPDEAKWSVVEDKNPWKSSKAFTGAEVAEYLKQGIKSHELVELDFEAREFGENWVAARSVLNLPEVSDGVGANGRGARSFYTVVESAPAELELRVTGGLIKHYRDRGNVRIALWKVGGASQTGELETLVGEDESVPPDGEERVVKLAVTEPGMYRIDVNDGKDLTRVTWPDGQVMSWKMTLNESPSMMSGRWGLYFYVPKGTQKIGLYVNVAGGVVLQPDGKEAVKLDGMKGEFVSVPVPSGMDGTLWKLNHIAGKVCLMNVPPYLAMNGEQLVLPNDVVE